MGNAAAKQLKETELGVGTVQEGDGKSIAKSLVSTADGNTKIKNKGKTWVRYDDGDTETLLWTSKSVGMIHSHSVIEDSAGKPVAVIVTAKKGLASCTNFVLRDVPSYDGQESLTAEELKKAGVKEGTELYKFAKLEVSRKLTTGTCTYGLVTGADDAVEALYEGEKLASMGFRAIFKEVGGDGGDAVVVGKAYTTGMSMSPKLDAAPNVDLLAVVSMGYALAGDDSGAGALAGAGVV
mmetsp:Transcript_11247/g.27023  ORF Transcript_11247/g.27023 Transcript_11247/m.27023 type:complete len:238 (+) Transcript_11247:126-839(+)|eukprot:CAMPEP_0197183216 /NCGR_PEP_ID=MMETSP1423-20130617/7675_1 /TAXON_ID=476441 /ORGANISM="Pseudo-nitzschia heimii, Strain UNC1101" /LENGTH=237 /DNA_ID=CAMNT_0042633779 /DNA_START=58 /DNA_END=771 /DNA_ORIENTATION=+